MKNKPLPPAPPIEAAETKTALDFVSGLQQLRKKSGDVDDAAIQKYLDKFSIGTLQRIARRIMMDIMKGPKGGAAAPKPDKAAPARKASGGKKAEKRASKRPAARSAPAKRGAGRRRTSGR